jgi:hypothetical protein
MKMAKAFIMNQYIHAYLRTNFLAPELKMFKARVTVPLKEINLFQLQQVYINLYT